MTAFGGAETSRRRRLTQNLLTLRDGLQANGVVGTLIVNGTYVSAQPEPGDFDVLLIASPDIQIRKDVEPLLADLLDAERAEEGGYSLFYIPANSAAFSTLRTLWDVTKDGRPKGVVEVAL